MPKKRFKKLETVSGSFEVFSRLILSQGCRADVQDYLESRGFAVYDGEPLRELRAAAKEDFDGAEDEREKEKAREKDGGLGRMQGKGAA